MAQLVEVAPGSPEWLAARRGGVTATDIVSILGLSSYDSPYSLFWRKLGQVPDEPDRDRWELGKILEPYVCKLWMQWYQDEHWLTEGGLWRSSAREWQLATPDAIVDYDGKPWGVFEAKSWADADRSSWEAGPPPRVRAQVLWQMDVLDVAAGHVGVVFLPSGRFESYTIEHQGAEHDIGAAMEWAINGNQDRLCSACGDIGLMRAAGEEFWRRLTLELPPPDPDSSAATLAAVRARFTRADAKQAEVDDAVFGHWRDAKEQAGHWDHLARGFEIQLREQAGEARELTVDGELVARRVIVDAQVKAHTRHQDYLRRVKPTGDSE